MKIINGGALNINSEIIDNVTGLGLNYAKGYNSTYNKEYMKKKF